MSKVFRIGRSRGSDISVLEMSVSRRHAELAFTDDGRCRLKDCHSTFGTFVLRNGRWKRIEETVVDLDDVLRFGDWQVKTNQIVKLLRAKESERRVQVEKTLLHHRRPDRKLAVILFADVAEFVRLVEENEAETLGTLMSHRDELIEPKISEYNGLIVKSVGDGVIVEFGSVIGAVQCAVEIQRGMAERNSDLPDKQRMLLRIGINLGDVVIEEGDIYGGGVNIASRLEGLAQPGGICVSAAVYEQIRNNRDLCFDDLGRQDIKNVLEPIQVYALRVAP